jgi:hypothetical protein
MTNTKPRNSWMNIIGPRGSVTFKGRLLGETTSHQDQHIHRDGDFARKNERCYACRWSWYQIYELDELDQRSKVAYGTAYDGRYLVASFGMTNVPGEEIFRRLDATDSPAEVIELLTTRKYGQRPQLTSAAARLLARVSDQDPAIQDAYENRAVL